MVDAEVVNQIIDSIIKAFDRVVRVRVLSGVRMVKTDQSGLIHVLYHEINTGDHGPVVSRPYRYDRVKQGGKNNWFRLKGERVKFSFSAKLGWCSILKNARDRRRVARMIIESGRSGGGLNCYEWVVMDVDMIVASS
ncbi:hypothetical protein TNCV_4985091 [Trichonephila clavipes]|nr:hypothetical protein TNCV_4985091 [Trichonephila clavipes]